MSKVALLLRLWLRQVVGLCSRSRSSCPGPGGWWWWSGRLPLFRSGGLSEQQGATSTSPNESGMSLLSRANGLPWLPLPGGDEWPLRPLDPAPPAEPPRQEVCVAAASAADFALPELEVTRHVPTLSPSPWPVPSTAKTRTAATTANDPPPAAQHPAALHRPAAPRRTLSPSFSSPYWCARRCPRILASRRRRCRSRPDRTRCEHCGCGCARNWAVAVIPFRHARHLELEVEKPCRRSC